MVISWVLMDKMREGRKEGRMKLAEEIYAMWIVLLSKDGMNLILIGRKKGRKEGRKEGRKKRNIIEKCRKDGLHILNEGGINST